MQEATSTEGLLESVRMRFVLMVLVVGACSGPECDLPEGTVYSCQPLQAGEGCEGGPSWLDENGVQHQDDAGLLFPIDCVARVPMCGTTMADRLRRFECDARGEAFEWVESL